VTFDENGYANEDLYLDENGNWVDRLKENAAGTKGSEQTPSPDFLPPPLGGEGRGGG
jgi:hypothetical protein